MNKNSFYACNKTKCAIEKLDKFLRTSVMIKKSAKKRAPGPNLPGDKSSGVARLSSGYGALRWLEVCQLAIV